MQRQTFIITIIILTSLIIGGAIFYFFFYKTPETGAPKVSIGTLFPFGQNSNNNTNTNPSTNDSTNTNGTEGGGSEEIKLPKLRVLWDKPVIASTSFNRIEKIETVSEESGTTQTTDITKTVVRFIERSNGHIHEIYSDSASVIDVTNTTIPRIQEAYFANNGNNIILRYIGTNERTIETYNASIGTTKNQYGLFDISGYFLEKDISEITVSPSGDKIFYLYPFGDATIGIYDNIAGTNKKQILSSTFSEWLPQFASETEIVMTTKASGYATGYSYVLNISEPNILKKILGDVTALTTQPIDNGNYVLFSKTRGTTPSISIYNSESRSEESLGISGIPSKCVWSEVKQSAFCAIPKNVPNGVYPDDWYQGKMFFTDSIWQIIPESNTLYLVSDLTKESGIEIDAINIGISPDGNYIHFTNKRDGSLWGLEI